MDENDIIVKANEIRADLDVIVELLAEEENNTILFKAPVGSMVISQLPLYLYIKGYRRIFVVSTKKKYLESQYRYIWSIVNANIKKEDRPIISYAMKYDSRLSQKSNIVYITADYLAKKLYQDQPRNPQGYMNFADVFIMNEASSDDLNYSMILLFIHNARNKGQNVKLIMTSPVEIQRPELNLFITEPLIVPSAEDDNIYADIEYVTPSKTFGKEFYESLMELIERAVSECQIGRVVLIFLPSKKEIERLYNRIVDKKLADVIQIYYGSEVAFTEITDHIDPQNVMIVLSTDLPDSIPNIDEVDIVIDTMQETGLRVRQTEIVEGDEDKETFNFPEDSSVVKVKQTITLDHADRRTARLGQNGFKCYRLINETVYKNVYRPAIYYKEDKQTKKESLYYLPLYNLFLDMIRNRVDIPEILLTLSLNKQHATMDLLRKYQFVDSNDLITPLGVFANNLGLSPTNCCILHEVITDTEYKGKYIFGTIAFLSIIECWKGYFREHIEDKEKVINAKLRLKTDPYFKQHTDTDMHFYLAILRQYFDIAGSISSTSIRANRFLSRNLLNSDNFADVINKMRAVISILQDRRLQVENNINELLTCIPIMRKILPKYYRSYETHYKDDQLTIVRYHPIKLTDLPIRVNTSTNNYLLLKPTQIIPLGNIILNAETIVGLSFF